MSAGTRLVPNSETRPNKHVYFLLTQLLATAPSGVCVCLCVYATASSLEWIIPQNAAKTMRSAPPSSVPGHGEPRRGGRTGRQRVSGVPPGGEAGELRFIELGSTAV